MGIVEAPRLQDVARLAGVSLATASRVLRHTAPVAKKHDTVSRLPSKR